MTTTDNYGLSLPDRGEKYSRSQYVENLRRLDEALGGVCFRVMTQAEYDKLARKDPSTLYIITEGAAK